MMNDRKHWLDGIADIADAETGDLRKLAEIAGENPATLFIGTAMNGADLRGQDLRGMVFTHLDMGRVLCDSDTIVESNPFIQEEVLPIELVDAVIYIAKDDTLEPKPTLEEFSDFRIFRRGEEALFADACRSFGGAKIVILDGDDLNQTVGFFPDASEILALALVDENETEIAGSLISDDMSRFLVIPRRPRQRPTSVKTQIGLLMSELLITVRNWELISSLAVEWRGATLFCAKSLRGDAEIGAWGRLYTRIARVRGQPVAGARLASPYEESAWLQTVERALFREIGRYEAYLPPRTAAVILKSLHGAAGPDFGAEYERTIQLLLLSLGWKVQRTFDPQPPDLDITDGRSKFRLSVVGAPSMTARPMPSEFRLPDFIDESTLTLAASEFFNLDELIFDLCHGKLWVSCQDLIRFRSGSDIWALFASHLTQVGQWTSPWARAAFITILVRDALHRQQSIFPLPERIQDVFLGSNVILEHNISCSNIRYRNNNVIAKVKVSSSRISGRGNFSLEIAVGFGGPSIMKIDLSG